MLGLGNSLSRGGVLSGFENTYSLDFDGTDDYVEVADDSTLQTTSITMACWFKPDGATEIGYLISKFDAETSGGYALQYQPTEDTIRLLCQGQGSVTSNAVFSDDDTWVHIVVTVDGNDVVIFYRNGVSAGTDTMELSTNSVTFRIGVRTGGSEVEHYIKGNIDEVAIWDVALDADAVSAIYNSGTPFALDADDGNYDNSGDLQGWWRFEEGSGTSAIDSSTNSNTGTLTNGPAYSTDVP